MKFTFTGLCQLTLDHTPGASKSKHVSTDINLIPSEGMQITKYLTEEGFPTEEGNKVLINVFLQGLAACIHKAQAEGWQPSTKEWAIAEITKVVDAEADVSTGYFEKDI